MDYTEVSIETTRPGAEELTAVLEDVAQGFVIDDPQDVQDLLDAPSPRWDYIDERLVARKSDQTGVTLRFYLEDSEDGQLSLAEARQRVEQLKSQGEEALGSLSMTVRPVRSEDWENNWKQYYKPFVVGPRLLVRPSWEEAQPEEGQKVLVMDPASSFGTGSHATTRLCLEELEGMDLEGRMLLDAGCGSGILAIAALLLGAREGMACDVEENAIRTTLENMEKNGLEKERCTLLQGDFLQDEAMYRQLAEHRYGIITANIVSDVLIAMAPHLCRWLVEEGDLLLSGIIDERGDEVLEAYEKEGMLVKKRKSREGWTMLHLGKKV